MPRARGPDRQAWQSSSDARTHGGASPVPLLLLATPSLVLHRGTPARDSSRTAWRQSKHVSLAGTAQHGAETSGVGRLGRRATGARVCARHGREGRYPTCAGASGTCRAVPRRCASPRRAIAAAGAARGRAPAPQRSRSPEAAASGSADAARGGARRKARTSALRAPRAGVAPAREPGLRGGVEKKMVEKRAMARVAPEVFESEGLQFRRTTDDAKELLNQMREGGLDDDPLERAREFMDSDEVDDWGAMYDDETSGR